MMRSFLLGLTLIVPLFLHGKADARPLHYVLDPAQSVVGFTVDMGESPLNGQMPVTKASLTLDFDRASASRVAVTLSPASAEMGLPFATEAMKSPQILDTRRFPEILFESTKVTADGEKARVEGRITIRGVTRPIILSARIFRPKGSAVGTRDRLTIRLTGTINRKDFGAVGYADMVGDLVTLDIKAHILLTD